MIKSRSFDKTKVTKGRNLESLRTDKVEISKRNVTEKTTIPTSNRNVEKKEQIKKEV